MQLLTGLGVPDAHRAVTAAGQHLAAVTAVQHILQGTAGPDKGSMGLQCDKCPRMHGYVTADCTKADGVIFELPGPKDE